MTLLRSNQLDVNIGSTQVCRSLSFQVEAGQRWALLGQNGIGKTTLLHTLAGLRGSEGGAVKLLGQNITELPPQKIAQHMGILFQHHDDSFPSTVLETALIGRHPYLKSWQWESDKDHVLAHEALAQMQLSGFANRQVNTLSGGERQRLAVSTLLTQSPTLMLLDEPCNHLDIHHQITTLDLLQQWSQQEQRALLMTLHDVNLALRYCDHAILLFGDGEFVLGPGDQVLTEENLERLYQHPLHKVSGDWGRAYLPG